MRRAATKCELAMHLPSFGRRTRGYIGVSGRDLDRGIEVDPSRRTPRTPGPLTRWRRAETILTHSAQVKLDRSSDSTQRRVDGLSGGHPAGQVRHGGAPVAVRILVDTHQVLDLPHDFPFLRPAWRTTDARVPFGMSSPGWPLTVTRPGLLGCLSCRWLPSVTTRHHPSRPR